MRTWFPHTQLIGERCIHRSAGLRATDYREADLVTRISGPLGGVSSGPGISPYDRERLRQNVVWERSCSKCKKTMKRLLIVAYGYRNLVEFTSPQQDAQTN